jgi:hypothetical protein
MFLLVFDRGRAFNTQFNMSRPLRTWPVVSRLSLLPLFAMLGCESREDAQRRAVAEAEARVYADEAVRMGDRGARATEAGQASELAFLHRVRDSQLAEVERTKTFLASAEAKRASKETVEEQTRLLGVADRQLALAKEKIEIQRKLVEASRDRLTKLKSETKASLASPRSDAGLSREILRERLEGIESSLAACTDALVEKNDGG